MIRIGDSVRVTYKRNPKWNKFVGTVIETTNAMCYVEYSKEDMQEIRDTIATGINFPAGWFSESLEKVHVSKELV